MLNIVLVNPEIPNNTGNIGRLCVGTGCHLHLIHPLGFEISDKQLKRSGLDYWQHLPYTEYQSIEDWWQTVPDKNRIFAFSAHATQSYYEAHFLDNDWLVFGKESQGLSEQDRQLLPQQLFIPKSDLVRSYNLANCVAFAIGEANRQIIKAL